MTMPTTWAPISCAVMVIATVSSTGCAERLSAPTEGSFLTGNWGGQGILVVLTDTGGTVEFDCARGTILGGVRTDSQGGFTSNGTYVAGEPGPARIGDVAAEQPARYLGTIRGNEMTLTVMLPASARSLGTFTVSHNNQALLRKCV